MPEPLILNPADNVAILTEKGVAAAGQVGGRLTVGDDQQHRLHRRMLPEEPVRQQ